MGPLTLTNRTISEIQLGSCVIDSLEKVKLFAKTKYFETVCFLNWVCLKLKIQTKSFTLTNNSGSAFLRRWCQCFFFWISTHAWTLRYTHTSQHSWEYYRHWVTWYTYKSSHVTLLCRLFQNCFTKSLMSVNEKQVWLLYQIILFRSVVSISSYHTSATITSKFGLSEKSGFCNKTHRG